jgi:hypothetical protein
MRRTEIEKQILSRRFQRRAAIANPFLVRSAIGVRLAPCSLRQAPRFGRARACASPGIRVSRSGFSRRNFERAMLRKIKYPPEMLARRVL